MLIIIDNNKTGYITRQQFYKFYMFVRYWDVCENILKLKKNAVINESKIK